MITKARKSYPTFEKLVARRIFIQDNPAIQTVKIGVYLTYQGRTSLRYQHLFSFDSEEHELILYDNQPEKSGLTNAISMINTGISETLRLNIANDPLDVNTFEKVDAVLMQFYNQNLNAQGDPDITAEVASQNTQTNKSQNRPLSSEAKSSAPQGDKRSPGLGLMRAISEAIYLAVAACMKSGTGSARSIRDNLHPLG